MPAFSLKKHRAASIWALYLIGLLPGLYAFYLGLTDALGADPVREFEHRLGLWALRFLCLGLALTPLRNLFKTNLIAYRRALGLLAFYYVVAHFTVYLTLDRGLNLNSIAGDLLRRPYIMLGMTALTLLIPLAATSNNWSIRKLNKKWITLHKAVYLITACGLLHFILSRKAFTLEPATYTAIITALIAYRFLPERWRVPHKKTKIAAN